MWLQVNPLIRISVYPLIRGEHLILKDFGIAYCFTD